MGFPKKRLGDGEQVAVHIRSHAKALILPSIAVILLGAAVGVAAAFLPVSMQPWGWIAIAVVALVLFVPLVLVPFLRWRTSTFTVTDRRLITRTGIINQTGHDLLLSRINDVSVERNLIDRMLGCGTLQIRTGSDGAPVRLDDIPDVEAVHVQITDLLFDSANTHFVRDR